MSVTVTKGKKGLIGGKLRVGNPIVTFDSSYLEGGEPVTAAELGFRRIVKSTWQFLNGSEEATVRPTNCWYTISTGKLHLLDSATGKEVASTKNMEKVKVEGEVFGY